MSCKPKRGMGKMVAERDGLKSYIKILCDAGMGEDYGISFCEDEDREMLFPLFL